MQSVRNGIIKGRIGFQSHQLESFSGGKTTIMHLQSIPKEKQNYISRLGDGQY